VDEVVAGQNGFTCVYFTPVTLQPAQSCTLTYKLCCDTFDNEARIDTATWRTARARSVCRA
jgi:hypothetical protein